ncbi:MAG TPA: hypothetical protein VFO93_00145 [Hymenobacter sp.]|uniref:hypothetical protein n=1 Tax=Hymenobacter sp. TaxID=1898978 RepID=UPI002D7F78C4|nr:hypothetical protein [Hymenobacter sp.]HET9501917.1 hypothetical protein [Hymenobacter sp.]
MKANSLPSASQLPTWHKSATAAPTWGTVSLSRQPVQALPQPAPGYHLQVLLRLWANL